MKRNPQPLIPAIVSIPDPFLLSVPLSAPFTRTPSRFCPPPQPAIQWGITLFCGLPEGSLGLMGSALKGVWGCYLKASSTLSHPSVAGLCLSDGTTPAGGYVWTSGQAKVSRLSVSAGALWQAFSFAQLYAGAGYGFRRQLWEESSGQWLEVKDLSAYGLAAEAGVRFLLGRCHILAGISTIGFRNVSAEVGVGLLF